LRRRTNGDCVSSRLSSVQPILDRRSNASHREFARRESRRRMPVTPLLQRSQHDRGERDWCDNARVSTRCPSLDSQDRFMER
jgi:hypothetical protein